MHCQQPIPASRGSCAWKTFALSAVILVAAVQTQAKVPFNNGSDETNRQSQAIVDGTIVEADISWMAALIVKTSNQEYLRSERQFCDGSLIAANWILTAAHCVTFNEPSDIQVVLGSMDLDDPSAQVLDVQEIVVHPFYSNDVAGDDIALLRLQQATDQQPVTLDSESSDEALSVLPGIVYGWGRTKDRIRESCELEFEDATIDESEYACLVQRFAQDSAATAFLSQAPQQIITDQECAQVYLQNFLGDSFNIAPLGSSPNASQNLCVYNPQQSSTPCQGDSGGPLLVQVDGKTRQVGILSRGHRSTCEEPGDLTIYTKVSFYLDFIEEVTGRDYTLGFEVYCPSQTEINASFEQLSTDMVLLTLSWEKVNSADSYLLRYLDAANPGELGRIEFGPDINEVSAEFPSGFDFLVSIQASGVNCDGPASELLSVKG